MSERCFLVLAQADDPAIQMLRQLLPQHLAGRDEKRHGLCSAAPDKTRLRSLAARGSCHGLLVHAGIADLSSSGWRSVVGRPELATAATDGSVLRAEQIAAVLCRLPTIRPEDLTHLHADDREFAAGEMHAFLQAWLSQLGERVCNQPDSTSLAGPAWLPQRWRWLAARSGIPSVAAASAGEQGDAVTVLVAGQEVLGTRDARLVRHALRLARAVRSTLLAMRFVKQSEWRFVSADPNPPLDEEAAAALLEWVFGSQLQLAMAGAR
jgi:hypothetical protein